MDEKKTEQEQTAKFERPSPAEPAAAAKARAAQEMPRRRVGSITLGGCLIAAGVFFLLYYFLPGFDWLLTLKIAPAVGLILLGCEVLFFSLRPGRAACSRTGSALSVCRLPILHRCWRRAQCRRRSTI